jgi:hypothetical protein
MDRTNLLLLEGQEERPRREVKKTERRRTLTEIFSGH